MGILRKTYNFFRKQFNWSTRYFYIGEDFFSIEDKWNYFNITIGNPFKTWWKARKYFKVPKTEIKFFCSKQHSMPYCWTGRNAKILDIFIEDLMWKDKWNSPRHERNPVIYFCLFNRMGFMAVPRIYSIDEFGDKKDMDMHYWEYILNFLYYKKTLKPDGFWETESRIAQWADYKTGEKKPYRLPIFEHLFSLNKKGLKLFKSYYEKGRDSGNSKTSS